MSRPIIPAVVGILAVASLASSAFASEAIPAKLQAEAKVSAADATATALAKVPNGTVSSTELEKEHGRLIWSFDIEKPGTKNITEVHVDARSGKILSEKTETPRTEAKEAATNQ
jgi:uncharacterized membrane protein YkoI